MQFRSYLVVFLALVSSSAYAAEAVNLRYQNETLGSQMLIALPGTTPAVELKEISKEVDAKGNVHIREQQFYKGYEVLGGEQFTHITANGKRKQNGVIYRNLNADLKGAPANIFTDEQANKAIAVAMDLYAKKLNQSIDPLQKDSKLVVYVDKKNQAHWVFQVSLYIKTPQAILNPYYLLDANTFDVYETWDDVRYFNKVKGGGLGGNPILGTYMYDGLANHLPALDMMRNPANSMCLLKNDIAAVYDGRSAVRTLTTIQYQVMGFKCAAANRAHGNVFWDGSFDKINQAPSPANDALYLAGKINQMYRDWFQIPVYADASDSTKSAIVNVVVHDNAYTPNYSGGQNGAWSLTSKMLYLGDGVDKAGNALSGQYPFAVPDVMAHELTHAFTNQHANFSSLKNGRGIDEAFSDMAAKAYEYYSTGKNSWTLGLDQRTGTPIRRYDNPTQDCPLQKEEPFCLDSGCFNVRMCPVDNVKDLDGMIVDEHFSAGIMDKAFYLLATSPNWTTRKAFEVMVQANRYHWPKEIDFQEAGCGVWDAGKDLSYSATDMDVIAQAFSQVGLNVSAAACSPT